MNDATIENPVVHSPRRGRPPKNHMAQPAGSAELEDARGNTRNGKAQKGRPRRVSLELQGEVKQTRKRGEEPAFPTEKQTKKGRPAKAKPAVDISFRSPEPSQSGTSKIALPLADTPVIRRNKEMREGRAGKGQRRSSLGMRGRRASSLIESGASNGMDFCNAQPFLTLEANLIRQLTLVAALPHKEVPTAEFYKHIASDGLSEPRRMKQLLTWCATRAMDDKPSGSRSDDDSARLAGKDFVDYKLRFLVFNFSLLGSFSSSPSYTRGAASGLFKQIRAIRLVFSRRCAGSCGCC